ncbi:MAG: LCP family protein [Eubacterium sp.]|nr:LCP family protein [Eubacterium sp.]
MSSRPQKDPEMEHRHSQRREHSRRSRGKMAARLIAMIIIILAALAIIFFLFLEGTLNSIKRVNKADEAYVARSDETFDVDTSASSDTMSASDVNFDTSNIDVMNSDDVKNILLIGQDKRADDTSRTRSDTMIIASINTKTNKITMVSLMRDMYVPIPGYSANRINAAYVLGGMSLLDQVIQEDFGITIDGNVVVDFDSFLETMTKIGDLEITLTEEEANYMNANEGLGSAEDNASVSEAWGLKEGKNTLTPEQALAYSRMRYVGNSDWERTERQRKLLTAVFNKVKKSSITKVLSMVSDLIPYFETDLSNKEILKYAKTVFSGDLSLNSKSYRIPVDGAYSSETINGMSVLVPDLEINSAYLQHYLYGTKLDEAIKNATVQASSSSDSNTGITSSSSSDSSSGYSYDSNDSTYNSADNGYSGGYSDGGNGYSGGTYDPGSADNSGSGYSGNTSDNSGGTNNSGSGTVVDPSQNNGQNTDNSGGTDNGTTDPGNGSGSGGGASDPGTTDNGGGDNGAADNGGGNATVQPAA